MALDARLWRPLFQPAGSDLRPGFLPFENCDLVAQPLNGLFEFANAVLLRVDYREQRFHQRRPLLRRNIRKCRESIRHTS